MINHNTIYRVKTTEEFSNTLEPFQKAAIDGEVLVFQINSQERLKLIAKTRWSYGTPIPYVTIEHQRLDLETWVKS